MANIAQVQARAHLSAALSHAFELAKVLNYATYLIGPRGPEYRRDDTAGTVRWYLFDGLGSVLGEVDPNGNITATRKLDVYGFVRSSTGTSTSKQKFVGGLGHQSDDETGLIYMRARYMDPTTGRFISEDPAKSGANWFAYCNDNPNNSIDQTGRSLEWVNHIFTDDNYGYQVWQQFQAAVESGDLSDFAYWLMDTFRGNMSLAAGVAGTAFGRFQLLLNIESVELQALASTDAEIGVGDYMRVEYIDGLIEGASEVGMADLETGATISTLDSMMGGI
jgi:RHS repeat-associated protein